MTNSGPIKVAQLFVDAINHHDLDEVFSRMAEEHVFIDSLGQRTRGRVNVRQGWEGYFQMVPDYTITIQDTFVRGATVVFLGAAEGTYSVNGVLLPENRWRTPAAWRGVVRGSRIQEWQVYADNEPIRQLLAKNQK